MVTVAEVYGNPVPRRFKRDLLQPPDPTQIWANYDVETDSMLIYVTGGPVRGTNVYLGEGLYVVVAPKTDQVVGFYIEAWDARYVPAHEAMSKSWGAVRETIPADLGWSELLRVWAYYLVALLVHSNIDPLQEMQPT